MDHAIIPRAQTTGEAPRLSPLEAFVQWVANFIRTITGMKRRRVFPKNWKDHWQGLRELEWYRDQILAFAAKHVLSGGSLNDHTDFQLTLEVLDDYGICPRTPHAMNQRFIAMAQFRLNPDKYIHRHIRRIARTAGITLTTDSSGCPLRHASHATSPNASHWRRKETVFWTSAGAFPPPRKARGRWRASSRDGGGERRRRRRDLIQWIKSRSERPGRGSRPALIAQQARAPPTQVRMFENLSPLPQTLRVRDRPCTPAAQSTAGGFTSSASLAHHVASGTPPAAFVPPSMDVTRSGI